MKPKLEYVCCCLTPATLARMTAEMTEIHADVADDKDDPVRKATAAALPIVFDALCANVGLPDALFLVAKAREKIIG
jgi:hypothetical protein